MKRFYIPDLLAAIGLAAGLMAFTAPAALAQYADRGITMPFTVTGGASVSDRVKASDPDASSLNGGFRSMLYPSFRLNSHWYAYSAIEVALAPPLYYEAFYPEKEFETRVDQLFLGYSWHRERASIAVKAGRMPSAFGAFPLRYDDTRNPLLDQPLAYAYAVKLRPDQNPCGAADLAHQRTYPVYTEHYCGGSTEEREGMTPATLYGIPALEADIAWRRWDARFQATNSSPANPQSLDSGSQHLQWTAGAGYTISQGFRIGVSGFQGPFLEKDVKPLLGPDKSVREYPANGLAIEGQWAKGRWSANVEWQRFAFQYPKFVESPTLTSGYAEIKSILTPRLYAAVRAGFKNYGSVEDCKGVVVDQFLPNIQSYEAAVGYHLNPHQTLKIGYEWFKTNGVAWNQNNIFGVQLVTSVSALAKAF